MYAILTKYNTLTCIRTTYDSFITAIKLDFEEWKCIYSMNETTNINEYLIDHCPVELSLYAMARSEGCLEKLILEVEEK